MLATPMMAADVNLTSLELQLERQLTIADGSGQLTARQTAKYRKQLEGVRNELKQLSLGDHLASVDQYKAISLRLHAMQRDIALERQKTQTASSFFHWY